MVRVVNDSDYLLRAIDAHLLRIVNTEELCTESNATLRFIRQGIELLKTTLNDLIEAKEAVIL